MPHIQKHVWYFAAVFCAILLLSMLVANRYERYSEEMEEQRTEEYARLVSHYLWTINKESTLDFLKLIVEDGPIIGVKIYHLDGTLFAEKESPGRVGPLDIGSWSRNIKKEIRHKGQNIGYLVATQERDMTINVYVLLFNLIFGLGVFLVAVYWAKRVEFDNLSRLATTVLKGAAEGIVVMDGRRRIEAVNDAFTRITGYQSHEVVGRDPSFRISGLHEKDFYREIEAALNVTGRWEGEVWHKRKNGEIYPEWLSVSLVRGRDAKPQHYISVFRDISSQKEAEAELIRARNRLAEAEQIAEMGSWEWKVKEDAYWWSDGIYRISGLDPKRQIADREVFIEQIHPDDAAHFAWKYNSAGGPHERLMEFRIIRPDNVVRDIEVVADFQRDVEGKLQRILGTARDVTEAKQVERALREAKEKAESADSAKSRFLAAASHDLRQPLQALSLFVAALEQLIEMDDRPDSGKKLGLIGKIGSSLGTLSDLLNALLDISRLDAGTLVPDIKQFAANDVLDWVRETYAPKANDAVLSLTVVPSTARIASDPQLLRQMMGNLVANAIRYTDSGKVLVGCRHRNNQLIFQVYDTGVGIPKSEFAAIFQEFHQLGNPERRREKGLGLGLSIVNRIARLMNHRIEVYSSIGKGSLFSIAVPLETEPIESSLETRRSVARSVPMAKATVLVIEDEPVVLEGMCTILEQWGLTPLPAESLEDALDQCRRAAQRPAVILADYRLQANCTGAEAIKAVTSELGVFIPGVIITGDTGADRIQEATASGYALLHKPLKSAKLKEVLSVLLQKESH